MLCGAGLSIGREDPDNLVRRNVIERTRADGVGARDESLPEKETKTMLAPTLFAAACLWSTVLPEPARLTVRDTIGKDWSGEPICWELELNRGRWDGSGGVEVRRDGQPVPGQVRVVSRHDDGSARRVEVRLVIDRLDRDASTDITCTFGKPGPGDTGLKIEEGAGFVVLANAHVAVKLIRRNAGGDASAYGPILGVRTRSGRWTAGSSYDTRTCKPAGSRTELLETGPVRLAARVTTTFDNGRSHTVTVSLTNDARAIDIDESFDLGPDDTYRFKEYANDHDELAWEWWTWYGDREGTAETHPNNWVVPLSSGQYRPVQVRYRGEASTDSDKGNTNGRGESAYVLSYTNKARLEKYLAGLDQWRPDAVTWYATSTGTESGDDVVAVFTHSVRNWRNPNVYPLTTGTTLRTGTNDMRIVSRAEDQALEVQCPIGLGHRTWAIRISDVAETFAATGAASTALSAEIVQRNLGLDVTRTWITDWDMTLDYPRLFVKPAQRDAFFARFRDRGVGLPGQPIDTFLRKQDAASFKQFLASTTALADKMIAGYFSTGTDNTNNYPGWMLGYWHGMTVAGNLDCLAGSPQARPDDIRALKKKLAILTYCLTSKDAWADKQINYGWGTMNMPVGRWSGLTVMASANSDHPLARTWLKDTGRYFRMLLEVEFSPDGVHMSCPHYSGTALNSICAWLIMANAGLTDDVSHLKTLERFARYCMQLMTPIDPRWGIRTLLTEGDSRPGSSPLPGVLATLFRTSNPELAGQLMRVWVEGGSDSGAGMVIPDAVIIDPAIPLRTPALGPELFPGFGAILRYRALGTAEEAYLSFLGGNFMVDHTNADQLAFSWYEKGVPLTLYTGDMYVPGAVTARSHNTLCWDFRPEGPPTRGKGKPGDWYHDNQVPWVEHTRRPALHLQIAGDPARQSVVDTRGRVSLGVDLPGAALLEGKVDVMALAEVPTRADYSVAMAAQAALPRHVLDAPAAWTRRLLYVKDSTAAGMNYLVVRDHLENFGEHVPSFNYWSLAEDVELAQHSASFKGQLGIDTDLFVAVPQEVTLARDTFTHDQCEPIVAGRNKRPFRETQVLARVEGQKGQGFLVVVFPRRPNQAQPNVAPWLAGKGVTISWQGQTHHVLLDVQAHSFADAGIRGETACLVVKSNDGKPHTVCLPAGGRAAGSTWQADSAGPAEWTVVDGTLTERRGKDLRAPAEAPRP